MRIVLDTNILVRALTEPSSSPASELYRLARDPHVLIISPFLLTELNRVLRYEHIRRRHKLEDAKLDRLVRRLEQACIMVTPRAAMVPPPIPSDPDDHAVIATAIAGNADVLCTRDRHFLKEAVRSHCATHGIRIMDDLDLLQLLRSNAPTD